MLASLLAALACSVKDRVVQERSADSGIESGEDGGLHDPRDGGGGRGGRGDGGPGSGRGGDGGGGGSGGTTASGGTCAAPCEQPPPTTCSGASCVAARVRGGLVEVQPAASANGLRLRAQGLATQARACGAVSGRTWCVSGGIGP